MAPWAAVTVEPDGTIRVYVHNWLLAGSASNPQELWDLVHAGWHKPEQFWKLFYETLQRGKEGKGGKELAGIKFDDLGL